MRPYALVVISISIVSIGLHMNSCSHWNVSFPRFNKQQRRGAIDQMAANFARTTEAKERHEIAKKLMENRRKKRLAFKKDESPHEVQEFLRDEGFQNLKAARDTVMAEEQALMEEVDRITVQVTSSLHN